MGQHHSIYPLMVKITHTLLICPWVLLVLPIVSFSSLPRWKYHANWTSLLHDLHCSFTSSHPCLNVFFQHFFSHTLPCSSLKIPWLRSLCSSERLVTIYYATQCHNQDDSNRSMWQKVYPQIQKKSRSRNVIKIGKVTDTVVQTHVIDGHRHNTFESIKKWMSYKQP